MSPPLRIALNLNNRAVVQQDGDAFTGKAPDLAQALGCSLGREIQLIGYPDAGAVVADVGHGWDLAFLAIDPSRAHLMQFSTPYYHVQATLMVRDSRPEADCSAVFDSDVSILSAGRAAYHGRLAAQIDPNRLIICDTARDAALAFRNDAAPILAGLRDGLSALQTEGSRILPDNFASIPQAVAMAPDHVRLAAQIEKIIARWCYSSTTSILEQRPCSA